jgi:predicted DNA-binding helix-hairpin-helix protein
VNRVSSDVPRARFGVREVVDLTLEFYRRNYIEGLFLSSGIIQSADYTTAQMVEVARQLRDDHQFRGYIHLKIIPGASRELVLAAGRHADRISANIELPTERDLQRLAPEKSRGGIERTMAYVREEQQEQRADFAPAGQTTQMICGRDREHRCRHPADRVGFVRAPSFASCLLLSVQPHPPGAPRPAVPTTGADA